MNFLIYLFKDFFISTLFFIFFPLYICLSYVNPLIGIADFYYHISFPFPLDFFSFLSLSSSLPVRSL